MGTHLFTTARSVGAIARVGSRLGGASPDLGVPARIGDNGTMASGELRESQYSVVLGLLKYGLQYQSKVGPEGQPAGIIGKLKGLFN